MKRVSIMFIAVLVIACAAAFAVRADDADPVITVNPQNYIWPEYGFASYTGEAQTASGEPVKDIRWYMEFEGNTYELNKLASQNYPWISQYVMPWNDGDPVRGLGTDGVLNLGRILKGLDGAEVYFRAYIGDRYAESQHAIVQFAAQDAYAPPVITSIPAEVRCAVGEDAAIVCYAKGQSPGASDFGNDLSYLWYTADKPVLQDIIAINRGAETRNYCPIDTTKPGVFYYCCYIKDNGVNGPGAEFANGTYTSFVTVYVFPSKIEAPVIDGAGRDMTYEIDPLAYYRAEVAAHCVNDWETLHYRWYCGTSPDKGAMKAVDNSDAYMFAPEQKPGTVYLCVCCWSEFCGVKSQEIFSDVWKVTMVDSSAAVTDSPQTTAVPGTTTAQGEETDLPGTTAPKEDETAAPGTDDVATIGPSGPSAEKVISVVGFTVAGAAVVIALILILTRKKRI